MYDRYLYVVSLVSDFLLSERRRVFQFLAESGQNIELSMNTSRDLTSLTSTFRSYVQTNDDSLDVSDAHYWCAFIQSVCPSVCASSVSRSIRPSVRPFVSMCLSVRQYVRPSVRLSVSKSVRLACVCQSVCPSVRPSVHQLSILSIVDLSMICSFHSDDVYY